MPPFPSPLSRSLEQSSAFPLVEEDEQTLGMLNITLVIMILMFRFFQLTPCEVQQSETWLVVVERTSAGQAYELKRYWQSKYFPHIFAQFSLEAIILDTTLGMKEMHTIASAKKSIFFSFASSWQPGPQTLTAVVDNVVGGEVCLSLHYILTLLRLRFKSATTTCLFRLVIPPTPVVPLTEDVMPQFHHALKI